MTPPATLDLTFSKSRPVTVRSGLSATGILSRGIFGARSAGALNSPTSARCSPRSPRPRALPAVHRRPEDAGLAVGVVELAGRKDRLGARVERGDVDHACRAGRLEGPSRAVVSARGGACRAAFADPALRTWTITLKIQYIPARRVRVLADALEVDPRSRRDRAAGPGGRAATSAAPAAPKKRNRKKNRFLGFMMPSSPDENISPGRMGVNRNY